MHRGNSSTCVENPSTPDMRRLIMDAGGDLRAGENRAAWLARVAEETGLSERTIKAAWHGERGAAKTIEKLEYAVRQNEYKKHLETAAGLEKLAFYLQEKDQDGFRLHIDVFRACAGQIRALVRTKGEIDHGE